MPPETPPTQGTLDFGWSYVALARDGIYYADRAGNPTRDITESHDFPFEEAVRFMLALEPEFLVRCSQIRLVKAGMINGKHPAANVDGEGKFEESKR
jgi:hypothetical protein